MVVFRLVGVVCFRIQLGFSFRTGGHPSDVTGCAEMGPLLFLVLLKVP